MEFEEAYRERSRKAAEAVVPLASAIRPLFIKTDHYPEQVASCVLLAMKKQVFVLSAAHAVGPYMKIGLHVGCGTAIHGIEKADGYFSARGKSGTHGDDPIDVAVLRWTSEVPAEIRSSCLSIDDLDLMRPEGARLFHVVCGFRAKESRVDATTARSRMERFIAPEWSDRVYAQFNASRERHVLLGNDSHYVVNGEVRRAPLPRGMSGGAIFKILGVPGRPHESLPINTPPQAKLSAIFIESHSSKTGREPALVGTRVITHLSLIAACFPQIVE